MCPDDPRLRVLTEQALQGSGSRMSVEHEPILLRKLPDAAHHRQLRVCATNMELPQRDVLVLLQSLLDVRDDRFVTKPTGGFPVLPVGSQLRNDQIRGLC